MNLIPQSSLPPPLTNLSTSTRKPRPHKRTPATATGTVSPEAGRTSLPVLPVCVSEDRADAARLQRLCHVADHDAVRKLLETDPVTGPRPIIRSVLRPERCAVVVKGVERTLCLPDVRVVALVDPQAAPRCLVDAYPVLEGTCEGREQEQTGGTRRDAEVPGSHLERIVGIWRISWEGGVGAVGRQVARLTTLLRPVRGSKPYL